MNDKRTKWMGLIALGVAITLGAWTAAGAATLAATGATQATYGPVLEEFGPVYFNGEVDFPTPLDRDFKAVFEVTEPMQENDARSAVCRRIADD